MTVILTLTEIILHIQKRNKYLLTTMSMALVANVTEKGWILPILAN